MITSDSPTETRSDRVNSDKSDRQDLSTVVKLFCTAAQNALAADFDGIEIQADFGYGINSSAEDTLKSRQNAELLLLAIKKVLKKLV